MGSAPSATTVSVLATGEKEGPFAIRRCPGYADGPFQNPPDCQTVQDCAKRSFKLFADRPYLGRRLIIDGKLDNKFTFKTYRECEEEVLNFGSGLIHKLDMQPQSFVGLYAENRMEWVHMINVSALYGHAIGGSGHGLLNERRREGRPVGLEQAHERIFEARPRGACRCAAA